MKKAFIILSFLLFNLKVQATEKEDFITDLDDKPGCEWALSVFQAERTEKINTAASVLTDEIVKAVEESKSKYLIEISNAGLDAIDLLGRLGAIDKLSLLKALFNNRILVNKPMVHIYGPETRLQARNAIAQIKMLRDLPQFDRSYWIHLATKNKEYDPYGFHKPYLNKYVDAINTNGSLSGMPHTKRIRDDSRNLKPLPSPLKDWLEKRIIHPDVKNELDKHKVRFQNTPHLLIQSETHYPSCNGISSSGEIVATGFEKGIVKLRKSNGELISQFETHADCRNILFAPDDSYVLIITTSGVLRFSIDGTYLNGYRLNKWIEAAAISPNGKDIAIAVNSTLHLFKPNGVLVKRIHPEKQNQEANKTEIRSIEFSPDEKFILTASNDGNVRLFDVQGNLLKSYDFGVWVTHAHFTMTKNGLAVVAMLRSAQMVPIEGSNGVFKNLIGMDISQRVVFWDLAEKISVLGTKEYLPSDMAVDYDSGRIVIGHTNGYLELWDASDQSLLASTKAHDDSIRSVLLSHGGLKAVSLGDRDNTTKIWSDKLDKPLVASISALVPRIPLTVPGAIPPDSLATKANIFLSREAFSIPSDKPNTNAGYGAVKLWNLDKL